MVKKCLLLHLLQFHFYIHMYNLGLSKFGLWWMLNTALNIKISGIDSNMYYLLYKSSVSLMSVNMG